MSLDQVSESDTLLGEQLMLPDKPVHVHQLSVDHTLQPNARVVDEDLAACHSGSQVVASVTGGIALLAVVLVGGLSLAAVVPPLFLLVSSIGFVVPNATALALSRHPEATGTGSALLGVIQSGVGAIGAPVVSIAGAGSAVPMAAVIAVSGTGAILAFLLNESGRAWSRASRGLEVIRGDAYGPKR